MVKARTETGRTVLGITRGHLESLLQKVTIPRFNQEPLFREKGHHGYEFEYHGDGDTNPPVSLCKHRPRSGKPS